MDSDDRQSGHSIKGDQLPAYSAEIEAEIHDTNRLPRLHSEVEIRRLFPTIPAAPAQPNLEDWIPTDVDAPRSHVQRYPGADLRTGNGIPARI